MMYANGVAAGGNAATMLKALQPKQLNANEDPNQMAVFMENMNESEAPQPPSDEEKAQIKEAIKADKDPEQGGANFAAQFAQEIA